ncbi:MAG: chemotaxis protein CheB [Spirochaetota bacterium]
MKKKKTSFGKKAAAKPKLHEALVHKPAARSDGGTARPGFPIVGIGASAGGLAAFEAFFSAMADTKSGMAFVLVQHLAPDHKSILGEIIQRYTPMRVVEVTDGMIVEPNCAYIIPPNRDMAFLDGALHLLEPAEPHGQRLPIDYFFRSLALDQRERAVCIVLSGTGSDGTLGMRAVKAEGGLVMVQSPGSAEYDGMPKSAIAGGIADYVLPPAEMPEHLLAYAGHMRGTSSHSGASIVFPDAVLKKVFILLRAQTGHDFSHYKPNTVNRRIERRMAVHQIESISNYVKFLQQTPEEVDALFRDLLIGVTNFFRDPEAFKALENEIIPALFSGKRSDAVIRVWSPGCSTGEEPYSIAILLAERIEALKRDFRVQIFATDIDGQSIRTARAGIYPASIAADISPERLARFFTREPDGSAYCIHKSIRDMLVFSEQDVIKDPPFSRIDLISCRNLLIYLGPELQKKIIPLFHYALNPGGILFLGTSETVGEFGDLFAAAERRSKLYKRKDGSPARSAMSFAPMVTSEKIVPLAAGDAADIGRQTLREFTEHALLQVTAPGVLVNHFGDILYLHGRTGQYLEPSSGAAGINNILKMAREGLRRDLTTALHKAVAGRTIVRRTGLRVKTNGDYTLVDLTIRPVARPSGNEVPLFLIVLEERPELPDARLVSRGKARHNGHHGVTAGSDSNVRSRVEKLTRQLKENEDYLQAANEELQTSNEELTSSNEEMQSVNEELQSANEELETSKEELQSINEELATVNAEMQTKVADLSRANNDMNNLLAGTSIGTVFVDHELRIMRYTPAAVQVINLIASDVGRSVAHVVLNISGYDRMVADITAVLESLVPYEKEVRTTAGAWYLMRIQPYRTIENVIEGAVITFVNISAAKEAASALRLNEERMRVALNGSRISVFNQDNELRYTWVYNPFPPFNAVLGKTDADMLPAEDAEILSAIKRHVLESGIGTRQEIVLAAAGHRSFDMTVEPLRDEGGIIGITCAIIDIPDRGNISPDTAV